MAKRGAVLLLLVILCVYEYIRTDTPDQNPYLITDYSRLHPVKVDRVVKGKEEEQLVRLLQEAKEKHLTVSIAGQRHSQGGHTYYKDGIVIDMTDYNRVLSVDPDQRQIRVQAGATWEQVQKAVNPYHLSVKTMQSQNIFTVGGSISVNAHGRDIRSGSLIGSVDSFRLLTADGQIRSVSREENPELFRLTLGGYGLFGIILDVTLNLTEDEVYRMENEAIKVEDYSRYFQENVLGDPDVRMHIARISVAPDRFLTDMYAINYTADPALPLEDYDKLRTREQGVIPSKIMFSLNRSSDWGKNAFWSLQKLYFTKQQNKAISRNNAMRSESEFMEYGQPGANDLLQEYFIPVNQFADFVHGMKDIVRDHKLNLLNITVRYVQEDREAVLSYAQKDMFALVCLFHVPLSEQGQAQVREGIRDLIDEVEYEGGTYYLPYAAYPTVEQFRRAYPEYDDFFRKKDEYDPQHLFMNYFYEQYKGE
ncbi:FAD-binding oxidoreductase [Paenibacillus sp. Y412MC10]|uniref:FAD-binding oxidoreductase n=1 Tax=Geobacillus sp. (strain Y412MC10) TaxID=481743 RepID=UPI00119D6266|nr:FAD-binding oxidoreductase [Paenibacillus sp. Y412MC10]